MKQQDLVFLGDGQAMELWFEAPHGIEVQMNGGLMLSAAASDSDPMTERLVDAMRHTAALPYRVNVAVVVDEAFVPALQIGYYYSAATSHHG